MLFGSTTVKSCAPGCTTSPALTTVPAITPANGARTVALRSCLLAGAYADFTFASCAIAVE